MEINLIGLIIGLVLFVIAYSFILYKIMLFNGSITTLQKQILKKDLEENLNKVYHYLLNNGYVYNKQ